VVRGVCYYSIVLPYCATSMADTDIDAIRKQKRAERNKRYRLKRKMEMQQQASTTLEIMELAVSSSSTSVSQTNGCMIQKLAVKGLQFALCKIGIDMRNVLCWHVFSCNAFLCNLVWHYFLNIINFSGYCLCGSAER